MVERTAEFILGLIGGILGIVGVAALLFFSAILVALGVSGSGVVAGYAIGGVILSIVGLIGAAFVKSHPRLASAAMLISGGLGFFVVLGFWIGALLLLVAGIIGLIRKEKPVEPKPATPSPPPPPAAPESAMMFCSRCGKQIARGSTFCQYCGARLA